MSARFVDIAGIGLNATDIVMEVARFPVADSKTRLLSVQTLPGGQTATAMIACARWGLRTRYIGRTGDDAGGKLHKEELDRAGVESRLIRVQNCASQVSFIFVDKSSGERTILWDRDPRLALRRSDFRRDWVISARLLHLDGHDPRAGVAAARWAHQAGIPVVADLDTVYPGLTRLLHFVDYPVTSRDFPFRVTGEEDLLRALPRIFARYRFRLLCCTLGRDGALAWDGTRFWYARSYRVRAVDTTGAGDLFHAGFAFGLLRGWEWQGILDFSCAAAGLNCTGLGARGGIRPLREIQRFCRTGRRNPAAFSLRELAEAAAAWKSRQERRATK
jgi:sulfofructose kinase